MKIELLNILRCPQTGAALGLESHGSQDAQDGWLVSADGRNRYPIRCGIPRFVPESNYADNFGMQWNHFRRTQLDSFSGHPISAKRFWGATGWQPDELAGKWILDAGCGAGRFAEIALEAGANVVAMDYSTAVDAAQENLREHSRLHVVQGDIFNLPFAPGAFDYVYSLGVLQHTPNVQRAFACLPRMLRPGGSICVDYYEKSWKSYLHAKYWLRPVTRRIPQRRLFSVLQRAVPVLLPVSCAVKRIPLVGNAASRLLPVVNYHGVLPLDSVQQAEWSLLDTFDWFAPAYDSPQDAATVRAWMDQAGLKDVEVLKAGHLVARGQTE